MTAVRRLVPTVGALAADDGRAVRTAGSVSALAVALAADVRHLSSPRRRCSNRFGVCLAVEDAADGVPAAGGAGSADVAVAVVVVVVVVVVAAAAAAVGAVAEVVVVAAGDVGSVAACVGSAVDSYALNAVLFAIIDSN